MQANGTWKKQLRAALAARGRRLSVAVICLLCTLSLSCADDLFGLTEGYVGNRDSAGDVMFLLTFNQAPDFFTVDQYDRQANGFQFYISGNTNVPCGFLPGRYASLIRGDEMWAADDIRIRNNGPPDPDPTSGGWGSIRGGVGYDLNGQTLRFTVPASVLNVSGPFAYSLLLTTHGAANSTIYTGLSGGPIDVPEPSLTVLLAAGMMTMMFLQCCRAIVRRRRIIHPGAVQ